MASVSALGAILFERFVTPVPAMSADGASRKNLASDLSTGVVAVSDAVGLSAVSGPIVCVMC